MQHKPLNILILCTGNSARSIMAEALINALGQGKWHAYSAGSHPTGKVNPYALEKVSEIPYPTEHLRSKSWDEFTQPNAPKLDVVMTVCDNAAGESCPIWLGHPISIHWGFEDPAAIKGTDAEKKEAFDRVFQKMKNQFQLMLKLPAASLEPKALKPELENIAIAIEDSKK